MSEIDFFAMVSRLKYIDRWALMRNSINENLAEHSLEVGMIAHALCVIGNKRFGKSLDSEKAAIIGMYHDVSEIITGDMPTPVKYYNPEIKAAYKDVEKKADDRMLSLLPEDLREEYQWVFNPPDEYAYEKRLVKAADKISAYIKCIEEKKAGNSEFKSAEKSTKDAIHDMGLPEAEVFMEQCIPSYKKTLDELKC